MMADYNNAPNSSSLLELCDLSSSTKSREQRLSMLQTWCEVHTTLTNQLLTQSVDKKSGCLPLHWLAGTGFDEAIEYLLDNTSDLEVDQPARHPSKDRTPLHYAARNGHLSTCQLLIEKYSANPHPKCGRGGVTPLQLAVWQNRLIIVQYLVKINGVEVIHERNDFDCGLQHWIGLIPKKRWCDNEMGKEENAGSGVIPLVEYLHSLGISYQSTRENSNAQGHTCNHKAAWGGNLALLKYFCQEHNVQDTMQDSAGNYSADLAKMRSHTKCHQWLLEHGSGERATSYKILGLEVGVGIDIVRTRFLELARQHHPDKKKVQDGDKKLGESSGNDDDFVKIKQAYEHLTKQNGVGTQQNPKYDTRQLLEYQKHISVSNGDDDDLFVARLMAIITDYGDKGYPVSLLARRWNQIWPDRPFPTEYMIVVVDKQNRQKKKKVKLLKWLQWKCKGTKIKFHATGGVALAVLDKSTREVQRPDISIITKAKELVKKFYEDHTEIKASHGWNHIKSVLDHANKALLSLPVALPSKIQIEIKLAALLHDMDDRKYFPNTPRGEYPNADKILDSVGLSSSSTDSKSSHELITKMISWVSCSENGNNVPDEVAENKSYYLLIPRWADRLCAVGSKGVVRCYQYNQEVGRPLSSDLSPRPLNEDELWSKYALPSKLEEYIARGGTSTDMMSHYYDKLLHIAKPPKEIVRNPYLEGQAESTSKALVEVCLRFGKTGKVDEEYIMKLMAEQ